jgi:hypothetical protein
MGRPQLRDPIKCCIRCGNQMTRKRFNGRLEDRHVFLRRRFCDQTCMAAAYVKDMPSKSALHYRVRKYRGRCCESCGATTKLHAHHIDGNRRNDSPANIQTLCASCHITHHHRARRAGLTVPGRMG